MKLPLIHFKEDGAEIIYCPALEVTGYGSTMEEAHKSFEISLSEFFRYTLNKKTLEKELRKLGWYIRKSKRKAMKPPSMSVLLKNNDNFSRIFNEHEFSKIERQISVPLVA